MVDAVTPFIDSSSRRLHAARVALRELFNSCGFAAHKWFWYAEVGTYGDSEEWWPLFSTKYRAADGQTVEKELDYVCSTNATGECQWPGFYNLYYQSTIKEGVLSVVTAVKKQFASVDEGISPRPVFAVFDSSEIHATAELQTTLAHRAEMISLLSSGRYQTLPSIEQADGMKRAAGMEQLAPSVDAYTKYVVNVMNLPLSLTEGVSGSLYPNQAWVYAVPIYHMRNARPLMLATFIILVAGPAVVLEYKEAVSRFREVEQCLISLEVHATHLLSHRFYHDIDGYVPGSDPIVLLAHPNLCRKNNLDILRMEGEEHDPDGYKESFDEEGSVLRRAYERTCITSPNGSHSDIREEALRAMKIQAQELTRQEELARNSPGTQSFSWLKPLYAHQRSRAHLPYEPSSNGEYHHNWLDLLSLCELIGTIDQPDGVNPSERFAKVHLYPFTKSDLDNPLFHWPVEPGVRLIIPWIHTVQVIAEQLSSDRMHVLLISGSDAPWKDDSSKSNCEFDSILIQDWLRLRDVTKPRPNGLVTALHRPPNAHSQRSEIEQMARGWTRALIDPLRRRGADTTLFRNLLLGDLGAAMLARGLAFPAGDPLFLPLESSMPIDVDISSSSDELLVAITWFARRR